MYPYNYIIPNNSNGMYRNTSALQGNSYSYDVYQDTNDERFLLAPLVVGGLAGTALGFGIANNNQINRPPCCGMPPVMPIPPIYIQQTPYPVQQPYNNFNGTNTFYR